MPRKLLNTFSSDFQKNNTKKHIFEETSYIFDRPLKFNGFWRQLYDVIHIIVLYWLPKVKKSFEVWSHSTFFNESQSEWLWKTQSHSKSFQKVNPNDFERRKVKKVKNYIDLFDFFSSWVHSFKGIDCDFLTEYE